MRITAIEPFVCDGGLREFGFLKVTTDDGLTGLGDAERELMRAKAVPQPFRTYTQPLRLGSAGAGDYQRVAIACDDVRGLIAAGIPAPVSMKRTSGVGAGSKRSARIAKNIP